MPEYRKIRERYSFLEICHQPELAAQITQLPIQVFGFDAAILFSDILVIPEALRVGLHFDEGIGPIIERPIRSIADIAALPSIDVRQSLSFVAKAIQINKKCLSVPLIGFAGAPFTVASYMIEGKSSRDLKETKKWIVREPESFHQLLNKIADCTIEYLNMQIEAGVDAIQLFDSWASVLSHFHFREFSLTYLDKIMKGLKKPIPIILFCRGSSVFAPQLAELSPAAIGLDWNANIGEMRQRISKQIALQGNLDPDILYAPSPVIKKEVENLLQQMKEEPGYIFNLGHGIHPDIAVDAVKTLVATVQES